MTTRSPNGPYGPTCYRHGRFIPRAEQPKPKELQCNLLPGLWGKQLFAPPPRMHGMQGSEKDMDFHIPVHPMSQKGNLLRPGWVQMASTTSEWKVSVYRGLGGAQGVQLRGGGGGALQTPHLQPPPPTTPRPPVSNQNQHLHPRGGVGGGE